jgi:hypothetical protein
LPFGSARTSPISATDVARLISTILGDPTGHRGKVYELTGPRSEDMNEMAKEYATALHHPVKYVDTLYDKSMFILVFNQRDISHSFSVCIHMLQQARDLDVLEP